MDVLPYNEFSQGSKSTGCTAPRDTTGPVARKTYFSRTRLQDLKNVSHTEGFVFMSDGGSSGTVSPGESFTERRTDSALTDASHSAIRLHLLLDAVLTKRQAGINRR